MTWRYLWCGLSWSQVINGCYTKTPHSLPDYRHWSLWTQISSYFLDVLGLNHLVPRGWKSELSPITYNDHSFYFDPNTEIFFSVLGLNLFNVFYDLTGLYVKLLNFQMTLDATSWQLCFSQIFLTWWCGGRSQTNSWMWSSCNEDLHHWVWWSGQKIGILAAFTSQRFWGKCKT